MTSKLEECARTVARKRWHRERLEDWHLALTEAREDMRAALQVLREPDNQAMADAGIIPIEEDGFGTDCYAVWQAMIDAILQEGE